MIKQLKKEKLTEGETERERVHQIDLSTYLVSHNIK